MRLTISQKRDAIAHLKIAGLSLQRDFYRSDDQMIARSVLNLIAMMPNLDTRGQVARHRVAAAARRYDSCVSVSSRLSTNANQIVFSSQNR